MGWARPEQRPRSSRSGGAGRTKGKPPSRRRGRRRRPERPGRESNPAFDHRGGCISDRSWPRADEDGADVPAAAAWSAHARRRPSTTAPCTGVVLAGLVRLGRLTGQLGPLLICQTRDHRCLLFRCPYAVPRVAPRGTAQNQLLRLLSTPPVRAAPQSVRTGRASNRRSASRRDSVEGRPVARSVLLCPQAVDERRRHAGRSRRRLGMSSVHTDPLQFAGIRLHRQLAGRATGPEPGKSGASASLR